MRIAACAASVLLAATLVGAQDTGQDIKRRGAEDKGTFATNRCFSKGGIGIVDTSLYIVVKSSKNDRNELILAPTEEKEERWKGKSVTKTEVVFVYQGKVWSSQGLPDRFDLSKAVVVSFEADKIRFFDFQATSGGYYRRISE